MNQIPARRRRTAVLVTTSIAALLLLPSFGEVSPASSSAELRVCADPNNMPFSDRREQGFENKIASLISGSLHRQLSYTWWVEREHFVKETLDKHRCDVLLSVPDNFEDVLTTDAYYRSQYVFVYRRDGSDHPQSLMDPVLQKLRIGSHVMGGGFSPPAEALASQGMRVNLIGFSMRGANGESDSPAQLITAVAQKTVDVAIVWGPLGGYFARRAATPLAVVPIKPDHWGPIPFVYGIAMGVGKTDTRLRDQLNQAFAAERREIDSILRSYDVPEPGPR